MAANYAEIDRVGKLKAGFQQVRVGQLFESVTTHTHTHTHTRTHTHTHTHTNQQRKSNKKKFLWIEI